MRCQHKFNPQYLGKTIPMISGDYLFRRFALDAPNTFGSNGLFKNNKVFKSFIYFSLFISSNFFFSYSLFVTWLSAANILLSVSQPVHQQQQLLCCCRCWRMPIDNKLCVSVCLPARASFQPLVLIFVPVYFTCKWIKVCPSSLLCHPSLGPAAV